MLYHCALHVAVSRAFLSVPHTARHIYGSGDGADGQETQVGRKAETAGKTFFLIMFFYSPLQNDQDLPQDTQV